MSTTPLASTWRIGVAAPDVRGAGVGVIVVTHPAKSRRRTRKRALGRDGGPTVESMGAERRKSARRLANRRPASHARTPSRRARMVADTHRSGWTLLASP